MYNRTWFEQRMSSYTGKSYKNIALILFSINCLQFINDTLGHVQGDQIIIDASKLLYETFSKVCQIARINGDQFAGLIENIDSQQLETITKNFIEINKEYNKTHTAHVLISAGYSHHGEGIVNTEIMYQEADNRMQQNTSKNSDKSKKLHIQTFLLALEQKRHLTSSGLKQTEMLTEEMAKALKLSANKRENLILFSRYYDIGKVGIPESILTKSTALHDIEWNLIRSHPVIGERIVSEVAELKHLGPLILKHHERWNGSGYPLGLFRTEIPLECRIIHLIDSFTAMTSSRPYRNSLSYQQARDEIASGSGIIYDPSLTEMMLSIIDRNPDKYASS